ncbi:MAG: LemA family protein [Sphingomonas sp.]
MTLRLGIALAAAGLLSACGLNSVPTAEETAKARWADVQNEYQRRSDLVPNLVTTVKAAGAQEKSILVEVTQARAAANTIRVSASDLSDPAKLQQFDRTQASLGLSLQRLQEAYPELQSQQGYKTLLSQLEGTENRITIARRDYNGAVQSYNTTIRTFPDAIGAKIFYGAKPLVPFAATTPGAEAAPKVDFGASN